jgi:hypothetical protein
MCHLNFLTDLIPNSRRPKKCLRVLESTNISSFAYVHVQFYNYAGCNDSNNINYVSDNNNNNNNNNKMAVSAKV